jgi:hypothetical protein
MSEANVLSGIPDPLPINTTITNFNIISGTDLSVLKENV